MFTVKSSQTVEIEVFVSHPDDDVEELIKDSEPMLWKAGHMYMNSSDLELGRFDIFRLNNQDTYFGYFYIGVRFRNVNLPKGAKIIKASIVFTAKNNDSNTPPVRMRIHGEYVGNAAEYNKDELKNLSNRTKTTASVLWNIPAWSAGDKGAAQTTVDLKNIVQEIASRTNWAANHAMNFIFTPEGDHVNKDERAGGRRALSFDGAKTQEQRRPVLKIVYEK